MIRKGWVLLMVVMVAACSNNQRSTRDKLDSIGKKFDSSAGRYWDSTKEKAKEIKAGIENRLNKKDSANRSDTTKNL
jgi:hypothetical protein